LATPTIICAASPMRAGWCSSLRHMWTAPIGKRFFAVTNDLVCIGHMSGLLVRHMTAGPDDFRLLRSPIIAASFEARDVWRGVLGFRWRPCRSSLLSCLPYLNRLTPVEFCLNCVLLLSH